MADGCSQLPHEPALRRIPRIAALHRAEGVEHDEVTHLPVVGIDPLGSSGMEVELLEQGAANDPLHPDDPHGTGTAAGCAGSGARGHASAFKVLDRF